MRLLVVEDDALLRERLARALRDRGLAVEVAGDHEEAMTLARMQSFDRAIVDLRLPGPSGLVVLEDLRALRPALAVIILTGYGSIATAVEAMRLGAWDYLTKPADVDQLLAAFDEPAEPEEGEYQVPSLARVEREHIERVLQECKGNISKAARALAIHRRTLQYKLAKFPVRRW